MYLFRMLFVALPWPSWRADLAPDYTIFMPVTNRSGTVYQNQVPARPNTVPVPNGEGNVGEGAVAAHGQNGVEMTNVNPANNPTADNGISTNAPNSSSLPLSIFSSFFNTNYQSISIAGREGNATSNPVHSRNEYTSVSTESSHGESQRPTYNV